MALAVSLWIAGGGVASADIYIDAKTQTVTGSVPSTGTVVPGKNETAEDKTLTITGAGWEGVLGGFLNETSSSGEAKEYRLIINNANVVSAMGARSVHASSNLVEGNFLKINNSTVGDATGGSSKFGDAINNQVELINSTVNDFVYGGQTAGANKNATGNSIYMTDSTVIGDVKGGYGSAGNGDLITGNKLYLSGANAIGGTVGNFATIKLVDNLKWNTDTPVLTANEFTAYGTLDVTALTNRTELGTVTLLSSNAANDFDTVKLAYDTATQTSPVTLDSNRTSQELKSAVKTSEEKGVTLDYKFTHTVSLDAANSYKNVFYTIANKVNTVTFGNMIWGTGRNASAAGYDYTNAKIDTSRFTLKNPESITAGETTLLTANDTLSDIAATAKNISYAYSPVDGVTINGLINGSYRTNDSHAIIYTATGNNATKLTFADVEWKDSGALLNHAATLSNVSFNGAAVDTTNIKFTNISKLDANKKMTLVSDFGDSVGTITGTNYKVGSTLQGKGRASLVGNDLIFTAETGTAQEQTHNTVMGAEVGMAALSAGNEFVGAATEGLADSNNAGTDGLATYAKMGGGSMNVETGSHVKTHTWNAILALGHKNEKKLSTTEYGAFVEYGRGNYSTFNGDERGDGSTHYTGGGILGKWQKNNGFYVEGSLRAGSIHDDAHNVLRDGAGNPYSYDTDATYWGAHVGVGREVKLNTKDALDLYAKYFYNHRGSVSFDAGGHYDLDAVESSVLRVGSRYTVKQNDKIKYYGGLAVEHEFCGRASGFADGVAIRGADIGGTSVRGEIGATMRPGEKQNVTLDLNLSGFAGKKRGFTGGLSAVFHI